MEWLIKEDIELICRKEAEKLRKDTSSFMNIGAALEADRILDAVSYLKTRKVTFCRDCRFRKRRPGNLYTCIKAGERSVFGQNEDGFCSAGIPSALPKDIIDDIWEISGKEEAGYERHTEDRSGS